MRILFCHKNFPAQFGHVARALYEQHGIEAAFVSEVAGNSVPGLRRIVYRPKGGATRQTHYCSRTFENYVAHSHGVYEALQAESDLQPDLIVGHSGFGNTLFLRELFDCPIISYFEYFYHTHGSDMDFRPEQQPSEMDLLRARARNSCLLADLHNCDAGYSPTAFQRSLFPSEYQPKLHTIFDGIDTEFWKPGTSDQSRELTINGRRISADTRVITYVSRGFESMRGFDIFMQAAKRIAEARSDVLFVCTGSDRVCYGGDLKNSEYKSYREKVLAEDSYPDDRFLFTGMLPPQQLARLFQRSDLHIYLTVPFVLSWSMMNALACGCLVLASDTAPVREMIRSGENGLLADFFSPDEFATRALEVLESPDTFVPLRRQARQTVEQEYSMEVCLPRMLQLFRSVAASSTD